MALIFILFYFLPLRDYLFQDASRLRSVYVFSCALVLPGVAYPSTPWLSLTVVLPSVNVLNYIRMHLFCNYFILTKWLLVHVFMLYTHVFKLFNLIRKNKKLCFYFSRSAVQIFIWLPGVLDMERSSQTKPHFRSNWILTRVDLCTFLLPVKCYADDPVLWF